MHAVLYVVLLLTNTADDESPPAVEPGDIVVVTAATAPLRNGDRVAGVAKYTCELRVQAVDGDRYQCVYNGGRGWVNRADVIPRSQAVAYFTEAIHRKPTAENFEIRSNYLVVAGHYDAAISDLDEALRQRPDNAGLLVGRGSARRLMGDFDGARSDLDAAIRIEPSRVEAYLHRACLRRDLRDLTGALSDLDKAVQIEPGRARSLHDRGATKFLAGDELGALEDFSSAIKADPDDDAAVDALVRRGWILRKQGRYAAALADYEEAAQRSPKHLQAQRALGWFLAVCPDEKIRDGDKAFEHALVACRITAAQDPASLQALAAAFAERGEFAQAVRWQSEALDLAPPSDKQSYANTLATYKEGKPFRQ